MTNVVAIEVAFSLVFWIAGYRHRAAPGGEGWWMFARRHVLSLGILAGLTLMLAIQLRQVVSQALFESGARGVLRRHFAADSGFFVDDLRLSKGKGGWLLRAIIRGPQAPTASEVRAAQADLPLSADGSKAVLRVRFIHVTVITPEGEIFRDDLDTAAGQ